jgi:hypothetical protein
MAERGWWLISREDSQEWARGRGCREMKEEETEGEEERLAQLE